MTASGRQIVEQFKHLSEPEKLEIFAVIARESRLKNVSANRSKTVAQVAGKYRPIQGRATGDLNAAFVEAIIESKGPSALG